MKKSWIIPNAKAWHVVARDIAKTLREGSILALQGPLGAGKTTFVQALAVALGAERVPKSPTFTLLRTYAINHRGLTRLLHLDAYRIDREADLLPLDIDEEVGARPGLAPTPERSSSSSGRRRCGMACEASAPDADD